MWIELCSFAERALNFMHTGSVKVLMPTIMDELWISRALINEGLPSFSPTIVTFGKTMDDGILISSTQWPFKCNKGKPISGAKKAQDITYGNLLHNVSTIHLIRQ
jgi:hypothetical protein